MRYDGRTLFDDLDLLQPRLMYERQDRRAEYKELVEELNASRREYLSGFTGLAPTIVGAI